MGIGSNLDSPLDQLNEALASLRALPTVEQFCVAQIVRTPPLGGPPQGDYFNTVAGFDCQLEAHDVLAHLQAIENEQGRTRDVHWGPRTIDLDLLLHRSLVINGHDLKIPHPGMCTREFVLVPLCELAPDLVHPVDQIPYATHLSRLLQRQPSSIISTHDHRR